MFEFDLPFLSYFKYLLKKSIFNRIILYLQYYVVDRFVLIAYLCLNL